KIRIMRVLHQKQKFPND
ncbi:plasmid stabilization protein ParE, partial [Vibrio cholerae]